MIKLKKIITHLQPELYNTLEGMLVKNKSENFLYLLQSYRHHDKSDVEICSYLGITSNSLYVLKSRLNDKIQDVLLGNLFSNKEEVLKSLHEIPETIFEKPSEIAVAYLEKLEADLLLYDMHSELLVVYSALKKLHLYSDKYFYYSQMYNRHAAFNLSLEKSEDLLGNFVRVLGQYNFSHAPKSLETLVFLKNEIGDHFKLNSSRQIQIIRNIVEVQLALFTTSQFLNDANIELFLDETEKLINELPENAIHKKWKSALDFLCFEYYFKIGQNNKTLEYFLKVDVRNILLFSHVCLTSKFLMSGVAFSCLIDNHKHLSTEKEIQFLENDHHTQVLIAIHEAVLYYQQNNIKEAINRLNAAGNVITFKDYLHINLEIKLFLSFLYIHADKKDLAENLLKNLTRKLKSEGGYDHLNHLIKVFMTDILPSKNNKEKQKNEFLLFTAKNNGQDEVLSFLTPILKKIYLS